MSEPTTTKALLVGIEKYEAGDGWNLNGPAHDVMRMARWLQVQGVPPENLTIFLSPLADNLAIVEEAKNLTGRPPVTATKSEIQNELTRLQQESASLFVFYWGGHGWVTQEGERRLFYADAKNKDKRNLDFNDLLVAMRSDYYGRMPQQLFIVDTCANYIRNVDTKPPSDELPKGKPITSHEQFALFAAKSGDRAKNLDSERTGLYTRELLAEFHSLSPNGTWPPDMEAISACLQRKFVDLRAQKLAEQTPAILWNRDWSGNERSFGQMPVAPATNQASSSTSTIIKGRELSLEERFRLLDLFTNCATLRSQDDRNAFIDQLRPDIRISIPRSARPNIDILNMIVTARRYKGGFNELLIILKGFEPNSDDFMVLMEEATRMLPDEVT